MQEPDLFYYARSRQQQAKVAAINVIFLPMVLGAFLYLVRSSEQFEQTQNIILIVLIIAEVFLLLLIVWLLRNPASFFIRLNQHELTTFHPMFKEWTFSVNPLEIIEVRQSTDSEAMLSSIRIIMRDGKSYALSPNFSYDRKQLYQALAHLNPAIIFPKHIALFSADRHTN
jgi:hypothetical protein